jgi:hypothetical protein
MALITPGYLPANYTPDRYIQENYFPEYGTATDWAKIIIQGVDGISGEPVMIIGKYRLP